MLGVCAGFLAALLVDQPLPDRQVIYHRLKLGVLCCLVFMGMAILPFYVAHDGDPARVVDPKLLNATRFAALCLPIALLVGVLWVPLTSVVAVSRKANVAVLGLVFMFVSVEIFLRLTRSSATNFSDGESWLIEPVGGKPRYDLKPDFTLEFRFPTNPRGYFEDGNVVRHRINADGYRGPLREVAKPAGTYRIVILGDSNAFGWGVHDADTPGAQLERALGGQVDGKRLEVLTFAAPGYTTSDERDVLEARALAYGPDLVLVWYSINDAAPDFDPAAEKVRSESGGAWFQGWSATADYLVSSVIGHRVNTRRHTKAQINEYQYDGVDWRRSRNALVEIRDLARAHGAELLVAIEPTLVDVPPEKYHFAPAHRIIAEFCAANDIPCCDLWPASRDRDPGTLKVHPTDPHSNEVGKGLYAQYLARELEREGLLR